MFLFPCRHADRILTTGNTETFRWVSIFKFYNYFRRVGEIFKLERKNSTTGGASNILIIALKGDKEGAPRLSQQARRILIIIPVLPYRGSFTVGWCRTTKQNHQEKHQTDIPLTGNSRTNLRTQRLKPYGKKSAKISLKIKPSLTHLIWQRPSDSRPSRPEPTDNGGQ